MQRVPARWGGTAGKAKMNPSPDRPTLNPTERDRSLAFNPESSFKFQPQHTHRSRSVVLPPSFWGRVTERFCYPADAHPTPIIQGSMGETRGVA